jgi:hypothetical protein
MMNGKPIRASHHRERIVPNSGETHFSPPAKWMKLIQPSRDLHDLTMNKNGIKTKQLTYYLIYVC